MANKFTDAAFKAQGIPGTEKLVLWVLCHRANNATGECFPSYARIAQDAGISRSCALRAVRSLIGRGVVCKVSTHGYKNGGDTNVFQVRIEKLNELSGQLRNETGVAVQSNPASCVPEPGELSSAVEGVAQGNSNSSTNSSLNTEYNSSCNSVQLVDQSEQPESIQSQLDQNHNPLAGYPSYNVPDEAKMTALLERLLDLWIECGHDLDAEEPGEFSASFNLMSIIWQGNPAAPPDYPVAAELEKVLRWLPKSRHWDKPAPGGLGRFHNSAEFCKAYPSVLRSYRKYVSAVEVAGRRA